MKYDKLLSDKINACVDVDYAKFHSGLVPNVKILGVKVPVLRQIAKEFAKFDDFLENVKLDTFEKISVACYYIGLTTIDDETLDSRLKFILPYIDNWAVCDTFVSSLKILKKNNNYLPNILELLDSENDFVVRFAIVVLMSYYIDKNTLNGYLQRFVNLQGKNYYIDMAIAWFVSVAFVKEREATLQFLKCKIFNKDVQNKSIQKICESFRVIKEDKVLVKKLKL